MKRFISILTTMVLILIITTTTFAFGMNSPPKSADNTYFIAFESKIDKNVIKAHGGEIKRQYKYIPVVTAKLSDKAAEALSKNPKISYIEKDAIAHTSSQVIPWGIPHVKATDVQALGYSGKGLKVGIIDTGIDYYHEDLLVSGGATFVDGTTDIWMIMGMVLL